MDIKNQLIPAQETTIYLFEDIVFFRFDMKAVTGKIYEDFENGKRRFCIEYKEGKLHGSCIEWYENGMLKCEYNYINGVKHGKFERWNASGNLFSLEHYDHDKLNGSRYLNFIEYWDNIEEFSLFDHNMLEIELYGPSDEILEENYQDGYISKQNRYVLYPYHKSKILEEGFTSIIGGCQINGIIDVDIDFDGEKVIYIETFGFVNEVLDYPVRPIEFLKFQNGEMHGRQLYWRNKNPDNENSTDYFICKEEQYKFGKKDGKQLIRYRNENVKEEENYVDGLKEGKQFKYDKEGLLEAEENYENGEKQGVQKYWDRYGTLTIEEYFKAGKLHGYRTERKSEIALDQQFNPFFEYDFKSQVELYEEGILQIRTVYNNNNEIQSEEYFKDGARHGLTKLYFDNYTPSCEINYIHGKINGIRRAWYDNGQLKFQQYYKKDKADGVITGWYNSGRKFYEWTYKEGLPIEFFRFWYDDGQLMVEGEYFEGKLKSIKYLDKQGNETKNFQMPFLLSIEEAPYLMFPDRIPEE